MRAILADPLLRVLLFWAAVAAALFGPSVLGGYTTW